MNSKPKKSSIDIEDKDKVRNIVAEVAAGKMAQDMALERLIKIMDDYADKTVISFLEAGTETSAD